MWTRWTFYSRGSAAASRSRQRRKLVVKEEVLRRDLGRVLLKLEELQGRADQTDACAEGRSGRRSATRTGPRR